MFDVFRIAGSALSAQQLRLNTTASNLANADSATSANGQPYRAKQVVFEAAPLPGTAGAGTAQPVGVQVRQVVESAAPPRMIYEPGNPLANEQGFVSMPNVNAVEEMVNMISASRSYQTNVEMMNTAKNLLLKTLSIGS